MTEKKTFPTGYSPSATEDLRSRGAQAALEAVQGEAAVYGGNRVLFNVALGGILGGTVAPALVFALDQLAGQNFRPPVDYTVYGMLGMSSTMATSAYLAVRNLNARSRVAIEEFRQGMWDSLTEKQQNVISEQLSHDE